MPGPPLTSAQADFITRFLGVKVPDHALVARDDADNDAADDQAEGTGFSRKDLGKARLGWARHQQQMLSEVARLKNAVRKAYGAAPEHKAAINTSLGRLDTALAQFSDVLGDQLDEVLSEPDDARRADLSGMAARTATGFLRLCDADPVLSGIDGNEFIPDMNIVGPARTRLREISEALGR